MRKSILQTQWRLVFGLGACWVWCMRAVLIYHAALILAHAWCMHPLVMN
jgi:hypothetical protein